MEGDESPNQKANYENRPDYTTLAGAQAEESGATRPAKPSTQERAGNAAASLKQAEQLASTTKDIGSAASGNVAAGVRAAKGIIDNTKGKAKLSTAKGSPLTAGNLKKFAPAIGVILLVAIPLIAIGSLLTAMPFHLLENTKDNFNSLGTANATAAKESYRAMLEDAAEGGYATIDEDGCADFGTSEDILYSACPEGAADPGIQAYFREKALEDSTLASTTLTTASGGGNVFKFTDKNGVSQIVSSGNFDSWWEDTDFKEAITKASLAWTGTVGGWFDDMAGELMTSLQTTRNSFQSYYEDINDQIKSEQTYRSIIGSVNQKGTMQHTSREKIIYYYNYNHSECGRVRRGETRKGDERRLDIQDLIDAGLATEIEFYTGDRQTLCELHLGNPPDKILLDDGTCKERYDEETNEVIGYECYGTAWYDVSTSAVVSEALDDAKEKVRGYLPEMANDLFNSSEDKDKTCSSLYGISYFSAITAATRLQQAADFAVKALETIDKTRDVGNATTPVHQFSSHMSDPGVYEYLPEDSDQPIMGDSRLPALNSSAISWLTTRTPVDPEDNNIKKLSLEGVMKGFILSMSTEAACRLSDAVHHSLFGLISIVTGFVDHLFTDANGQRDVNFMLLNKKESDALVDAAITRAAYGLIFNPCTEPAGEDVGNCLALGTHYYLSKNHQLAGGSPADEAKLKQFLKEHRETITANAARERSTRSPFDISSQYTFLGSIVHSIIPYTATFSSSFFTSIGSIVSSSVNSLFPTASALEEDVILKNVGNCTFLGSGTYANMPNGWYANSEGGVGAMGDVFCVPYMINDIDPAVRDLSPLEIETKLKSEFDALDGSGNIKEGSNLARYVMYCTNRYSTFGIIDANILKSYMDFIHETKGEAGGLSGLFYNIATLILGKNRLDAENLEEYEETAINWSTGQYCIATSDDTNREDLDYAPTSWDLETRYYQAYVTYRRINSNRDASLANPSLDVIKGFQEAYPLDNSPDGALARIAGMTTEDYIATRDYVAYSAANKSSFGPFTASVPAHQALTTRFHTSITPLTDFVMETVLPLTAPDLTDPRQQGTTA